MGEEKSMNLADAEGALEGLRRGLRSDGADLVVNSLSDDCIELSLIFESDACLECIVSSELLLAKIRIVLSKISPILPKIVLHDPRD